MHTDTTTVRGYAGLHRFQPIRLARCATVGAVQDEIVRAGAAGLHVRPLGLGYSWSPSLATDDVSVSVEPLRRVAVDRARQTVVAEAGARLGDVTLALASFGFCLPSLPFLAEMTVGGAVATASHGTSAHWGTLSDAVRTVDVVTPSGEWRRFGAAGEDDAVRAARTSVGMLGVIVRVELQAVQIPWVRPVSVETDLDGLFRRLDDLLAYGHVWVHWTLGSDRVVAMLLEERRTEAPGFHPYVEGRNARWTTPGRGLGRLLPAALAPLAARIRARSGDRHDAASDAAGTADAAIRVSMQYAVPRRSLGTIVERVARSAFSAENARRVLELKFLRNSDRSLLGSNSGEDVVLFNAYWQVAPGRRFSALRPFEELMREFGARPHWGKLHRPVDIATVERIFPDWPVFDRIRRDLDPDRMFSIFPEELAPENNRAGRGRDRPTPGREAAALAVTGSGSP